MDTHLKHRFERYLTVQRRLYINCNVCIIIAMELLKKKNSMLLDYNYIFCIEALSFYESHMIGNIIFITLCSHVSI